MTTNRRARISIDKDGYVWGEGDEFLDGTLYFIAGRFHYDTFRGKSAQHERLSAVLTTVARQLGYGSAIEIVHG